MSKDRSYPSKLRVYDRPLSVNLEEWSQGPGGVLSPSGLAVKGPHNVAEFAARLYASESLQQSASSRRKPEQAEPYSLQWFQNIEAIRHTRQGRWIPRLMEFNKHAGETLLCLGRGLGTDWVQYSLNGASVVVCSPSNSQLALVRRNFELRGLPGRFMHASLGGLPLESASIDVSCIVGILEIAPDPQTIIDEVYRVLKPGGKVLAVTPAAFDVEYWQSMIFFWLRWMPGRQLLPDATLRFSSRDLRQLFDRFVEHRTHKRHLRRCEVPHVWRWLPMPMLERLLGHLLVHKAFKPLSAALPAQAVAA